MEIPQIESIKKRFDDLTELIEWVADIWRSKNWVRRLVLLDILIFIALNPYFPTALRLIPTSWMPGRYDAYFWAAIAGVFIIALAITIISKSHRPILRGPVERRTIKGLLPFGISDKDIFARLQRENELIECYGAVTDGNFRFGILSGDSGNGKTSFLQAGLWPALLRDHRCVYVKMTNADPAETIRQALAEQIGLPGNIPFEEPLSSLLSICAGAETRPLILLLDQFEQFFVYSKRESKRRPFIREMNEWYRNQKRAPIKVLVCIRSDFLDHLSEFQEAMKYSLGPQEKFRLKKFTPEQAMAIFQVIAETEDIECDQGFIKELAEKELAGIEEGLVSPVNIQILAWMIAGQSSRRERAFSRNSFHRLGGVEGLLELFLTRALDARETVSRQEIAIKVMLALIDLDKNTRAGALTLDDLQCRLSGANVAADEIREATEWLDRARLIAPVKHEKMRAYELAHERLIPALRRIANKQLGDTERANILLDRRANEWQGNNRESRYLLIRPELRLIKKQRPFLQWEPNRSIKQALIAASRRRIKLRDTTVALLGLIVIALALVGYSQWGQLQLMKVELAIITHLARGNPVPTVTACTYAMMGNLAKAVQTAKKINDTNQINLVPKVSALLDIADIAARLGDKDQANALITMVLQVLDKEIYRDYQKALVLTKLADTAAKLQENDRAKALLTRAIQTAEKIDDRSSDYYYAPNVLWKADVLLDQAGTAAILQDRDQTTNILNMVLQIAEKIDDEPSEAQIRDKVKILRALADTAAKIQYKEWISPIYTQLIQTAEKNNLPRYSKSNVGEALAILAGVAATLQDKDLAKNLLTQAIQTVKEVGVGYSALANLAGAAATLQDKDLAKNLLTQAIQTAKEISDESSKAKALANLAGAAATLQLQERDMAKDLLNQAIQTAENVKDEQHKVEDVLMTINAAAIKLGDSYHTNALLKKSLNIAKKLDISDTDTQLLLEDIARNAAKIGDYRLAHAVVIEQLSMGKSPFTLAQILQTHAKLHDARLGNMQEGLSPHYTEYRMDRGPIRFAHDRSAGSVMSFVSW
jgi:tetratricopeptide (TPR) repeat protein